MQVNRTITLNNGKTIPTIGYGVWQVEENIEECVHAALECGYRHIDTAAAYGNEAGVGKALKNCGIPRDQLFITTKLWNEDMRQDRPVEAFYDSLEKLGLEYVDLYLIHWPVVGKYIDSYLALEKLVEEGRIKSLGVSNCLRHQLDALLDKCGIIPAVNQIQVHPRWTNNDLIAYCQGRGIAVECYSPLGHGDLINHPLIKEVADKYAKTTAQVMIRWHLQRGCIVMPKSSHVDRIRSNFQVYDFEIAAEDMVKIESLNDDTCYGGHPDTFDF